jgi:imidazolonepropionase-like amidohydrolase
LSWILDNANVVDVADGTIKDNVAIAIHGPLIHDVAKPRKGAKGNRIDMQGSYVLPGLINVHNNLSLVFPFRDTDPTESPAVTVLRCYRRAHDALQAGVTTLRTVGEMHRADIWLRKMINDGWVQGPRIVAGGKGLAVTGGHGAGFGQAEVNGAEQFRAAARTELAFGAEHLKIFITGGIAQRAEQFEESQMTREEIEAVVSVAKSKGTYVAAHAGSSGPIRTAAAAGVTSFEHGYVLNQAAARAIKRVHGYLVPTLSVTRSARWMREHGFEDWTIQKALAAGSTHLQSARTAIREGVQVVNGTDLPPGEHNEGAMATVRELEFLMEAGLDALRAIRASTIVAAQLCRIGERVGLVQSGYQADLIAVPKNPLAEVRSLRRIQFVMKGGEIIRNELRA